MDRLRELATAPVGRLLVRYSAPAIVGTVVMALYNIIDSVVIGHAIDDPNVVSGIAVTFPVMNLATALGMLIGAGAAARVSIVMGQDDRRQANLILGNSILLTIIIGVLYMSAFAIWLDPLLRLFGASPNSLPYAREFLLWVLPGMVLMNLTFSYNNVMRASGYPGRAMATNLIGAGMNVILAPLFLFVFQWGIRGAAIATDISQLVSCVLSLRFLMKVDADYKVELSAIRPDQRMTSRIIRIGLPTGIQNMVISFSNVLVQSSVNSYGAAAMAGFAAYMKIDGFNILPVTSFSMAATTFVGQNYGAGNLKRVKNGMWVTLGMGVLYTLCTGALLLAFQNPIMHLFTSDETVVAFGCSAMHYFCPFYFLLAILHGMAGAVRGTGRSVPPMVVLLISLCLFRVVWIQFVLPFFAGIEGVFVLYPVSWALGAVLMALYAWKGSWMTYEHS